MSALTFALASAGAAVAAIATAALLRGRMFATFVGVMLSLHTVISVALYPHVGRAWPLFVALQGVTFVRMLTLARPRMRSLPYRALISIPAAYFISASVLALPWALVPTFGLRPAGLWVPYALGLVGLFDSLVSVPETVDIALDRQDAGPAPRRYPRGKPGDERPLLMVQITDPHLGPFVSERRLRRVCERAVAREPDLILLTGDYLTMDSKGDPEILGRALAPLAGLPGRVFACLGNHDLESPQLVRRALESVGARLLVDEDALVETPLGPIQIVGAAFHWRGRPEHLARLCAEVPRRGRLRVTLLHDPAAFRFLPEGEGDLVLSGHTHGGQLGLLRVGLAGTFVSVVSKVPDHGLWARGVDRVYVNRGIGHYGFPLRLGVPPEESLLRVHLPPVDLPPAA